MKIKSVIIIIITMVSTNIYTQQLVEQVDLNRSISIDGMHIEEDGTIYAVEGWDGTKINKIDPNGDVTEFSLGYRGPIDIVKGNDGNFYISEWQGSRITKVDKNGKFIKAIPIKPGPGPMTKDALGNMYVTHNVNDGSGHISKISITDEVTIFSSDPKLVNPGGIDIDNKGNIYVVNFNNADLIQIKPDKTSKLIATLPGKSQWKSGHLKVVGNKIYITGAQENKIYSVDFNGNIEVFINAVSSNSNEALKPKIENPIGLTCDKKNHTLYISKGFVKMESLIKVNLKR